MYMFHQTQPCFLIPARLVESPFLPILPNHEKHPGRHHCPLCLV